MFIIELQYFTHNNKLKWFEIFLVYVLPLIFLLIKIFMSGWCYNIINSKSLVVIAGQLMADEALLI